MSEKEKYNDNMALIDLMSDIMKLLAKGIEGEELVKKLDNLTEKAVKKIQNVKIREGIKKNYTKHINQYLHNIGYDNLKLIKE